MPDPVLEKHYETLYWDRPVQVTGLIFLRLSLGGLIKGLTQKVVGTPRNISVCEVPFMFIFLKCGNPYRLPPLEIGVSHLTDITTWCPLLPYAEGAGFTPPAAEDQLDPITAWQKRV